MRAHLLALLIAATAPAISYAQPPEAPNGEEAEEDNAEEYVQQGNIELGGAVGLSFQENLYTITATPTFGYFFYDRWEISAQLNLVYTRERDEIMDVDFVTKSGAIVVEPSYHHPLGDDLLALAGLGVGTGWDGDHWDFEIIPRLGMNVLTTGSTAITPSVRLPIKIGESFGDMEGDVGADVALTFDVAVTTTW